MPVSAERWHVDLSHLIVEFACYILLQVYTFITECHFWITLNYVSSYLPYG